MVMPRQMQCAVRHEVGEVIPRAAARLARFTLHDAKRDCDITELARHAGGKRQDVR